MKRESHTEMQQPQRNAVKREGGRVENGTAARRPRLRLPFDDRRRGDAGVWAYDHRAGLAVTLIVYLLVGIAFVAGKIGVSGHRSNSTIVIDFEDIARLDEEKERLQRELERLQREQTDWRSIRNVASNENALNENLKDDRGTQTSQLNESAAEVERRMRANREAYEQGLAEAKAAGERKGDDKSDNTDRSAKVAGTVTVSYSLNNPVRHHRYLDKPAYRCEGGGEVVVSITVDRSGKVIAASHVSGGDNCMRETALGAARASTFNIDNTAPAKQQGTITYIFIPQ